jgi:hypothetical protein
MKVTKILTIMTASILLLSLFVSSAVAQEYAGFEIDGNTASDGAADWETVISGGAPDWDAGPGILIKDGNSGPKSTLPEENIFAKGGKFGDPAGWIIEPGNSPAQNDLTNVEVYATKDSSSGDSWLFMGMERIKKQGTFDLDFEYNKIPWDGTSGTLQRSVGDLVVGFELSGNPTGPDDLEVLIAIYEPDNLDCTGYSAVYGAGFCEVFRGAAGSLGSYGAATMNEVSFPAPPWGSVDSAGNPVTDIQPFFFAEAAINLSELGIELGCPGFGSVHAKSRSSLEVTADLKDLAGPRAFTVSCYIDGYKFHDLNADGAWQLGADGEPNTGDLGEEPTLSGWTINLYKSAVLVDSTTTDTDGYFRFDGLSDGNYTIQEVCPTGWNQSYPSPNPATTCGNNTHTFAIDINNPNFSGNFGNYQNATLSGTKFKDADGDGSFDTGESGLDGWSIYVYADNGDGVLGLGDTLATSATTSGGGAYSFSLTPGDYLICEVAQANWSQTAPSNSICAADPDGYGFADGGFAITVTSGQLSSSNDFGNTPLSNFDVNFYDLTGFTNATISCVDALDNPVGSSSTDESASPETTLTATGQTIGTYTCTITITDP